MRIHAEPKPLHEPLSGGKPGSTVVVEPLIAGHVSWPKDTMESPGGRFLDLRLARALFSSKDRWMVPCPAFLIRHPSAGPVLVDTGLHPSVASDPGANFGRLAARFAPPQLEKGEDVPAQLRKRGIEPSKVGVVVMTHLHVDHASAISEFPDSTFVLSEAEWEDATTGRRPIMRGYRPIHYDFVFDYRTIDFGRSSVSSYASFGRTFDLFGDGSIRLAYTPGHSAGHMSVIARLRERDFLIGGDAVYTFRQLEGGPPPPRPFDAHNWRRSLQEIKLFRSQFPHAIVTPGHDVSFYEQLGKRYYD
jgi:N-acyl homoserine lactone hydrolase